MARHTGEANMKPFNTLPPEEARKIQSKGGKARAEKVRERKKIKEDLLIMLDTVMSNGKTTQENWMSALAKNLLKGDMQTATFVRDTIGEKPVDKLQVSGDVSKVANDIGEFVDANTTTKKHN